MRRLRAGHNRATTYRMLRFANIALLRRALALRFRREYGNILCCMAPDQRNELVRHLHVRDVIEHRIELGIGRTQLLDQRLDRRILIDETAHLRLLVVGQRHLAAGLPIDKGDDLPEKLV